jgi:hypothetical protein
MNVISGGAFECSDVKPEVPWVISASIVGVWHFGHGGLRNAIMALALKEAGALQNSESPIDAVMGAVMQFPWDQCHLRRCSILLIFEKLNKLCHR